jgi:8-oxo-dGTP diphosphatase
MTTTAARARGARGGDSYRKDCIVMDMDGTLTPDPHSPWRYDPDALDVRLITECQAAGYAVAISTCGVVAQIAEALEAAGIACWADDRMTRWDWHDGTVVLVTNRKVHGLVFLDDHAELWRRIEAEKGYRWCPGPQRRHWGPDGAAGLLPWTIRDGKVRVLLSERSPHVQGGRCWASAGGAIEPGESALEAAVREAREELTGLDHLATSEPHIAECASGCGWTYTTYPAQMTSEAGRLPVVRVSRANSWETLSVRWFGVDELPADLHPGFRAGWPELRARIEALAAA